jgi:hypothetical protein
MKRRKRKPLSLTAKAEAAFAQACRKLVLRARQTGTPIVVWEDGQIREIPPDQVELPPAPGDPKARKKHDK